MATEIYGYVEFQNADLDEGAERKQWWAVIDAAIILDRSCAMFGSLFGVRNPTDFVPVASNRGLPDDISEEDTGNAVLKGNHSYTWITWEELQAIDWDAMGLIFRSWRSVCVGRVYKFAQRKRHCHQHEPQG